MFDAQKLVNIGKNWNTCPDDDILYFKKWLSSKMNFLDATQIQMRVSETGWIGEEATFEIFICKPKKYHFIFPTASLKDESLGCFFGCLYGEECDFCHAN